MLMGSRPFVFLVDQVTTSISILILLDSGSFVVDDQVATTFLCPLGLWAFYFVANQIVATS